MILGHDPWIVKQTSVAELVLLRFKDQDPVTGAVGVSAGGDEDLRAAVRKRRAGDRLVGSRQVGSSQEAERRARLSTF